MSEFTEQMKRAAEIGTVADMRLAIEQGIMLIDGQRTDLAEYESQLDAKDAHIEELSGYLAKIKPVLQTIAMDRGKGSKADVLFNELLALLNQSPATSLEQVKREAIKEAGDKCTRYFTGQFFEEEVYGLPVCKLSDLLGYANNLKEKG